MTDDRKSGIALIAGSFGGLLTVAIHPRASGSLTAGQVAHLAVASAAAHSLAIVSFVILFLGACGLVRRIAAADRIAFAAIVIYGFACVAILIAAAVSGFIVPDIMLRMVRDVPAAAQQWKIVISGIFQINQAFARIYAVGAFLAIFLWSISALRNGGLGRGVAIYGCLIAPLIILGIVSGHLRLDVHGMGIVALAHAIWFVIIGVELCSRGASARASGGG
ncbi:MAG: hypothetical protein WB992_20380 [Bryobacteraceae bacterium]